MNLGKEEKKFYESAYHKFELSRQVLNDKNCYKLLERGIEDMDVCNKVRELLFEGQKDKVLSKQEFFKLLKFISALQNGFTIDNISIQDLPELPAPKLPKKSARETMRESKMGASGISLVQSEANGSLVKKNSSDEMEPVFKNSGNKENTMANHSQPDLMSQVLEKESGSRNPRDQEEGKVEAKNSIVKRPTMEELDEDLAGPEQIEKHTVQEISGSVFIKDANMLSNPFGFGDDLMNASLVQSKVIPKPEPGLGEKEEKKEDNAVEENDDDDKYDRIISSKKRNQGNGAAYVFDPKEYNQFMESSQKLKIEVVGATSNAGGRLGFGAFTTYKIKAVFPDSNIFETEKRFSDFDWLNTYLKSHPQYKGLIFLRLPDKKAFGASEATFVQQRKSELEAYLKDLGRHPIISQDEVFRSFLGDERNKSFQSHRDSKPLPGTGLAELDLQKVKEGFEYVKASVSTKLSKEEATFDWKGVEGTLNEVFEMDNLLSGTQKFLQKIQEIHERTQQLGSNLNITSTKIMNRIDDPKFYALGSLSSLFTAEVRRASQETPIVEDFVKEVKYFRGKIEGVKQSHGLMLSCLQQILTYKELLKTKYGKIYEYQANNDQAEIDSANRDSEGLGQKIKALYTETETIRDNLNSEIAELMNEFEVCFPNGVNEYYIKQVENAKNVKSIFDFSTILC